VMFIIIIIIFIIIINKYLNGSKYEHTIGNAAQHAKPLKIARSISD
jgi:hypothetical protein